MKESNSEPRRKGPILQIRHTQDCAFPDCKNKLLKITETSDIWTFCKIEQPLTSLC